ncbi:hypothetical protein [Leifsonia sp. NPDC058230]
MDKDAQNQPVAVAPDQSRGRHLAPVPLPDPEAVDDSDEEDGRL